VHSQHRGQVHQQLLIHIIHSLTNVVSVDLVANPFISYQEVSQLLLSPFTTSNKVEDSTSAIPNMLIQKDSYSPHGTLEEFLLERSAQWDHAGGKLLQSLELLLVQ